MPQFCLRIGPTRRDPNGAPERTPIEAQPTHRNVPHRLYTWAAAISLFIAPFPSTAGWRTAMLLIAASALAFLALSGRRGLGLASLPREFTVAALGWVALCVASLAWTDVGWYTSEELRRELLYSVLTFVVFYAGTREPRDLHIGVKALIAGALVMGALEWVRQLFPWLPRAVKYEAAQGSFSTHLAIVAPLLALIAWPGPVGMAARPRTIALLAIGLIVSGLATENRMLWLSLAAGAVVAFVVFQAGAVPDRHRTRLRRVLLATLAVIALVIAASWEYKVARYYPKAATTVESLSMDERPRVWAAAIALFEERPLLGHGFGREIVGDRIERSLPEDRRQPRIRHGHNVFLDVALQLGALGFAIFVALLATLVHAHARMRRTQLGAPIAIAGLAMIATFVTKNQTDDFFYRPGSLTFWAINGMLLAIATRVALNPAPPAARDSSPP
ncbi:MAG TPA: O-antigen ligase family protein [Usitatibacter sp.]|nr:O-antigen ligase family protein [Usitatibacter sp.]